MASNGIPKTPPSTALAVGGNAPTNPYSSGTDIAHFLASLQNIGPYVHPRAISFRHSGERADWREHMPDAHTRDTFGGFYCARKGGRDTWIGLFSTSTGPLVGDIWREADWHCFTLAVVSNPAGGKVLIFWDCDPKEGVTAATRAKDALFGKQRTFVEYVYREKTKELEIWYNVDDTFSGKGKCLPLSMEKATAWATLGDFPFQGDNDPRVHGCVKLSKL